MSQRLEAVRGPLPWYKNAGKLVTAAASTGAACVSIFSFLYSYGIVGEAESHKSIGNIGAELDDCAGLSLPSARSE